MKSESVIKIDGASHKVISEVIGQKIWFKVNEQTFSYDIIDLKQSAHSKNKSSLKSSDKINAPMPGKVTKIFVGQDQLVKKGDSLVVIEAMKMEYTLKSDIEATVEKINVQLQEQVSLGHLLIQLKEKSS